MKPWRTILILLVMTLLSGAVNAQSPVNRAGVVVRFGNGEVVTACITFNEPTISGLDLLERSGLPVISQQSSIGAAVCKIGRDGCDYPATSCFCARDQGRVVYWAFYRRENGAWRYSNLGASNVLVNDGDLHGWAWGPGDASGGAVPPDLELNDVCGQTAPLPTTVPTATIPTVAPKPTATITPTVMEAPTITTTRPTAPATVPRPSSPTAEAPTAPPITPISSPLPSPTSPSPTLPTITETATPTTARDGNGQWLGFLALAALLIMGIVVTLRRRNKG
ncbi:hypothetical protein [Chloroflexus sp. Y-396-1]|uniref:hypothetical protein n=1 Tax=Chloroflexus sp. Y-396-1 TaxID=867845 RepID=UPI00048B40C9|nr:hypothetical protein [Chloroflexus sp. Y-396-1]